MLISPNTNLIDLPLSPQIVNPLHKESIAKLGDVLLCEETDLRGVNQLGVKKIETIVTFLAKQNLRLRSQEAFWPRAVEIYGSPAKVALWPAGMHLFTWGSQTQQPRADKKRVVTQLKSAELFLVSDLLGVREHERDGLLKELVGELRTERLRGWLHGVGIYRM